MESPEKNLIELLTANAWQQELNTWVFNETSIIIKDYSQSNFARIIPYSIVRSYDGSFILETTVKEFGNFTLSVNYENQLPKIILQSRSDSTMHFELQAYNRFTDEQKQIVENRIGLLRAAYESKRVEITAEINRLKRTTPSNANSLIRKYEQFIFQMNYKIETVEIIVRTTINIATNFHQYMKTLDDDVKKLEDEIRST